MFKIEILPFLHCAVDSLLNRQVLSSGSVRWSTTPPSVRRLDRIQRCERFPPTSRASRWNIPTETAGVAQPLRFRQIGFAALQLGGPFRHLCLEFVAGFTKLLLASRVSLPRRGADRQGGELSEMPLRRDSPLPRSSSWSISVGKSARSQAAATRPPSASMPTGMTIPRHRCASLPMSERFPCETSGD